MRALHEIRIYLIGLKHFFVEVDAKYIKGMINNPDLQPNATINRWIVAILLFNFTIIHTPASKHTDSDGLSRRRHADSNSQTDETYDKWIDEQYEFIANLDTKGESEPLSRSERGIAVDESLLRIRKFLTNSTHSSEMTENEFRHFIVKVSRFFVRKGDL